MPGSETHQELEVAADLVTDALAYDAALTHSPLRVDAAELAERLGPRECVVEIVLNVYADDEEMPVETNGEEWEVAG